MKRALPLLVLLLLTTPLVASLGHHLLAASAEAEMDPDSGLLEMTVHLVPRDLEAALTAQAAKAVRLDRLKPEALDAACSAYLSAHVRLLVPSVIEAGTASAAAFSYLGSDLQLTDAWLYFTLDAAGTLDGKTLEVTLLEGLHPEYLSTVTLGRGKDKRSLRFDREISRRKL